MGPTKANHDLHLFVVRDKKVEDDRKYELENTPDEKERKEKIKAWKDDAGNTLFSFIPS
jgi:hypothetical protein